MTKVNWEREPGETIEEFVAAMLLLDHPHGNQITPSRGDRGVDIRVWNSDGFDVYQVKRFARPLTSKQATNIEESWETFVEETLPTLSVRSWTLVTPWEPSNERLDWLKELTAGSNIHIEWMGGRTLDGMASRRPSLVDYFFGDGGERLHRLMADALQGGREVSKGIAGEDLVNAVITRHKVLAAALNEVDPFYRYELEVRTGKFCDQPWDADARSNSNIVLIQYKQFDTDSYLVTRLVARSVESPRLRPIVVSSELIADRGSPQERALEDFREFGAPIRDMPGWINEVNGPPGLTAFSGPGRISILPLPVVNAPDLEARLLSPDGSVLHTLNLINVEVARGLNGPGSWMSARDPSDVLRFELLLNGTGGQTLQITPSSLTGKTPAEALPAMRMAADLTEDNSLVLAIRGGKPISPVWQQLQSPLTTQARLYLPLLEALQSIQAHTYKRVVVPHLPTGPASAHWRARILYVARLLRGEQINISWTEVPLSLGAAENLPITGTEFALMSVSPLLVDLGGYQIRLDMDQRVIYQSARVQDLVASGESKSGDTITLVPGSDPTAIVVAVPAQED